MIAIDIKFCFNITSIAQSTNKTHWIANVEVNMALYEKALKVIKSWCGDARFLCILSAIFNGVL